MAPILETFCVYHVTAPGQENGAEDLPEDYSNATMDELSEQVGQHTPSTTIPDGAVTCHAVHRIQDFLRFLVQRSETNRFYNKVV